MKLLTATTETQGQRTGDFCWCVPGELLTVVVVPCDACAADPDHDHGCGRVFAGFGSRCATTTAIVADLEGWDFRRLLTAIRSYHDAIGVHDEEAARNEARILAQGAEIYDVGDVLEVRLGRVSRRRAAQEG